MLKQELVVAALEKGCATEEPAKLLVLAEEIDELSRSDAFGKYETRPIVAPRVAAFRALRARYVEEGGGLLEAARAGDRAALVASLTRLRSTCDGCHAQFRPGL